MATDIKKAIREKMKERKIKCTDLAKTLGMNPRRVQEFFSEETVATLKKAELFIDAVGLELCEAKTAEKLEKAEKLLLMLGVEIAKDK
jgi:ribosome-binding protein aMBF1 (putative translation factor)